MALTLHLKQGDIVLGTLKETDNDFPWRYCTFTPTDAFQSVKPLFDRAREQVEAEEWEQFDKAYQQIEALGLRLVDPLSGDEIREFLLHIEGDSASFRY
ncbi:MAG: hypothetical protein EDM79_20875 [Chloroflexi bacterium]|nr:MAG: hypothetical protein EDM79_20875 [Chloroflexota bacterium]